MLCGHRTRCCLGSEHDHPGWGPSQCAERSEGADQHPEASRHGGCFWRGNTQGDFQIRCGVAGRKLFWRDLREPGGLKNLQPDGSRVGHTKEPGKARLDLENCSHWGSDAPKCLRSLGQAGGPPKEASLLVFKHLLEFDSASDGHKRPGRSQLRRHRHA